MKIKLQFGLELDVDAKLSYQQAVAEALEYHANELRSDEAMPESGVVEVPNGQLSYAFTEVS